MSVPSLYLETSVWGSLASRQPRDRKQVVNRLLQLLESGRGECVISDVVLEEVKAAQAHDADRMREAISNTEIAVYSITDEMLALARAYIDAGVLPEGKVSDALHVAAATCSEVDYLVSWNHRHMTRPMKRLQYESVNQLHGRLKTPLICNPFEACDEI